MGGAERPEVSGKGRRHQVEGNGEPEVLPDTHNLSPRRFYLHPELSNDLVGTHPPGAHSLVAVSVGEVWPWAVPCSVPRGVFTGSSVPDTGPSSHVAMSQAPQTIALFLAKDSGSFLSHGTRSQEVLGTGLSSGRAGPWGVPKVPTWGWWSELVPLSGSTSYRVIETGTQTAPISSFCCVGLPTHFPGGLPGPVRCGAHRDRGGFVGTAFPDPFFIHGLPDPRLFP